MSPGEIPVYGTGGYMCSVDKALSYSKDAIGIGRKGTIDNPFLLRAPFWTVDTLFYAIPIKEMDIRFLDLLFKTIRWQNYDESTGVPSLSKQTICSICISLPNIEEQKKIGDFKTILDRFITLHQCNRE